MEVFETSVETTTSDHGQSQLEEEVIDHTCPIILQDDDEDNDCFINSDEISPEMFPSTSSKTDSPPNKDAAFSSSEGPPNVPNGHIDAVSSESNHQEKGDRTDKMDTSINSNTSVLDNLEETMDMVIKSHGDISWDTSNTHFKDDEMDESACEEFGLENASSSGSLSTFQLIVYSKPFQQGFRRLIVTRSYATDTNLKDKKCDVYYTYKSINRRLRSRQDVSRFLEYNKYQFTGLIASVHFTFSKLRISKPPFETVVRARSTRTNNEVKNSFKSSPASRKKLPSPLPSPEKPNDTDSEISTPGICTSRRKCPPNLVRHVRASPGCPGTPTLTPSPFAASTQPASATISSSSNGPSLSPYSTSTNSTTSVLTMSASQLMLLKQFATSKENKSSDQLKQKENERDSSSKPIVIRPGPLSSKPAAYFQKPNAKRSVRPGPLSSKRALLSTSKPYRPGPASVKRRKLMESSVVVQIDSDGQDRSDTGSEGSEEFIEFIPRMQTLKRSYPSWDSSKVRKLPASRNPYSMHSELESVTNDHQFIPFEQWKRPCSIYCFPSNTPPTMSCTGCFVLWHKECVVIPTAVFMPRLFQCSNCTVVLAERKKLQQAKNKQVHITSFAASTNQLTASTKPSIEPASTDIEGPRKLQALSSVITTTSVGSESVVTLKLVYSFTKLTNGYFLLTLPKTVELMPMMKTKRFYLGVNQGRVYHVEPANVGQSNTEVRILLPEISPRMPPPNFHMMVVSMSLDLAALQKVRSSVFTPSGLNFPSSSISDKILLPLMSSGSKSNESNDDCQIIGEDNVSSSRAPNVKPVLVEPPASSPVVPKKTPVTLLRQSNSNTTTTVEASSLKRHVKLQVNPWSFPPPTCSPVAARYLGYPGDSLLAGMSIMDSVFSWLPPDDVAKCRAVCRKWKRLIDSSDFWSAVQIDCMSVFNWGSLGVWLSRRGTHSLTIRVPSMSRYSTSFTQECLAQCVRSGHLSDQLTSLAIHWYATENSPDEVQPCLQDTTEKNGEDQSLGSETGTIQPRVNGQKAISESTDSLSLSLLHILSLLPKLEMCSLTLSSSVTLNCLFPDSLMSSSSPPTVTKLKTMIFNNLKCSELLHFSPSQFPSLSSLSLHDCSFLSSIACLPGNLSELILKFSDDVIFTDVHQLSTKVIRWNNIVLHCSVVSFNLTTLVIALATLPKVYSIKVIGLTQKLRSEFKMSLMKTNLSMSDKVQLV